LYETTITVQRHLIPLKYKVESTAFSSSNLLIEEIFVILQEGWSLAESFCVRCIVAAPYVVPYRYLTSPSPSYMISNSLEFGYRYDFFWVSNYSFVRASMIKNS